MLISVTTYEKLARFFNLEYRRVDLEMNNGFIPIDALAAAI